jgi:hypothetical protein
MIMPVSFGTHLRQNYHGVAAAIAPFLRAA